MHLQADTAPIGMRNMAKKRAPKDVVPVAMAFPTAATSIRPIICSDRSSKRADVHVTVIETTNVANYKPTEGPVSESMSEVAQMRSTGE